ncbi:MAG: DNA polymerase IV [Planctomycetota bacterium]|nr:DNA polymerase IV [Planctomycetota bacterium]
MTKFWEKAFLHCDMDAFFASVEQLDFPELKGKPVIVGGEPGTRTVVCASSYEARVFGVRSAMPVRMAQNLCPDGIYRKPRFRRYLETSEQMMNIFREYSPLVEPISIDEAFIDVTGSQRLFGTPEEIAQEIKDRVLDEIGLTISIGCSTSMFVAKMGSSTDKPDGLSVVPPGHEKEFLAPFEIGDMWGIGEATERILLKHGIRTIGDLAKTSLKWLFDRFGIIGRQMYLLANALDLREVSLGIMPKNVTNGMTLEQNTTSLPLLCSHLLYISHLVGFRLRQAGLAGETVVLKGRWDDMTSFTRNMRIPFPTDIDEDIFYCGTELLKAEPLILPMRKIGVGVTKITRSVDPYLLTEAQRKRRLDRAFDHIERKYGNGVIAKAGVLEHVRRPVAEHPFMIPQERKGMVESDKNDKSKDRP